MLTKIAAVTALLSAVVNAAVLLGVDLSPDQIAAVNGVIVAAGAVAHSWFNPDVPIGPQQES